MRRASLVLGLAAGLGVVQASAAPSQAERLNRAELEALRSRNGPLAVPKPVPEPAQPVLGTPLMPWFKR